MPRKPPQPLPDIPRADEIVPMVKRILAAQRAAREHAAATISPSEAAFANVIAPFLKADDSTQGETGVFGLLRFSGPDKATREAIEEGQRLWSASTAERLQLKGVFELVQAVRERNEELGHEERRILEDLWLDYRGVGHGVLDEEGIAAYLERRERIEELKREFRKNLHTGGGGVWFDDAELEGVPASEMERWKVGREDVPGEKGRRFVPLERADYDAVLRHARDPEARRRMYAAFDSRFPENVPLFKEMLVLRDENARLLGYKSHADFRMERKIAPSAGWVERFLERLTKDLIPRGKEEMQRLERKKREHLHAPGAAVGDSGDAGKILPWDFEYYTRLLQEEADVDHQRIAEYFPLRHTLSAMLGLFTDFLGLEFVAVPKEDLVGKVWDEEVEVWSVWEGRGERKGEFVGYLYADVLWREGKYRTACNVNLQCGYVREDGSRVYPATVLMSAFQPPTAASCALLKHREVVTLFHELGHGLHDLLCRTKHTRFHGTRVAPDFCEAPSTMLETWCWMPTELVKMSQHYTRVDAAYMSKWKEDHPSVEEPPSEKIPEALVERLVESRELNRGLWFLHQLVFATFDLAVNNQESTQALRDLDEVKFYNDLQDSLSLRPNPGKRGYGLVHSTHLIELYDAGYYAYLSAQAFAADFFETYFARDPRGPEAWENYRRGVLEYGGSRDAMEMMTDFLGREPGPDALLRSLGLTKEDRKPLGV
ncbi:metallopeptidase [Colletotrichum tofieldiae]|uniref:Metallopeptidase (Peptidase family M3) n=1 Tax=Colletotrichum tofieldiae TaxID=708197 RepID=A0A166WKA5_9PEZI|nr:metallopeptidase (peptidase family M3) [Colletotrichum tofieldiae]GKT55645.1 metallopeptidase [Colletotrichum tofieldiae]GKT81677.1 metallopeptidase [Colletotrichum tofieldiae]GKT82695.1 metallopeptidase [Colletotrichum tofieldiae]